MVKKTNLNYKKLSNWIEPEKVFTTLFANETASFWLDSSLINETNRFSYMGIPSEIVTYSLSENKITVKKRGKSVYLNRDIFSYLNERLKHRSCEKNNLPFDFTGGYVGYFGYELKSLLGGKTTYKSPYPDSLWYYTDCFLVFDHKEKTVLLVYLTDQLNQAEKWFEEIDKTLKNTDQVVSEQPKQNGIKPNFRLGRNHKQYIKDIQKCKEYLTEGESYQICLTNTLSTQTKVDPLQLYLNLRTSNPAPYAAYIKYHDLSILCSSPEQFLKIDQDKWIETKPIKGTICRVETPQEDKKLREKLIASKKDRSENAMIVDLLRNDLGKICEFGSIRVSKLMEIETYQTVHHLVSTIRGKLLKDKSIIDSIKACFPGGSMTGCPKIETMEILNSLEHQARGIYSGALGFLSLKNTANLNIIIRTIIIKEGDLTIGAGGAILAESVPENEFDEMLLKAKVLMQTIMKNVEAKE